MNEDPRNILWADHCSLFCLTASDGKATVAPTCAILRIDSPARNDASSSERLST
jgi:hypothetical protein